MTRPVITLAEIEDLLNEPESTMPERAAWVARLAARGTTGLPDSAIAEIACERDPAGPEATIRGLLEAVMLRHRDDAATVAALTAVLTYHLPDVQG